MTVEKRKLFIFEKHSTLSCSKHTAKVLRSNLGTTRHAMTLDKPLTADLLSGATTINSSRKNIELTKVSPDSTPIPQSSRQAALFFFSEVVSVKRVNDFFHVEKHNLQNIRFPTTFINSNNIQLIIIFHFTI
jgi:hypothetical protein